MKHKELTIVDMFCGGGGESCGLMQAAAEMDYNVHLCAINHWERAIETHAANYPNAEHHCESVEKLDPTKVVKNKKLDLLWASPECTHHSNARGGRPRSDQSRSSAWMILKWLSELHVERVIIENVKEFLSWGALDENGKPVPELKGHTFNAFITSLQSLGYTVDWQLLRACDYGSPTIRTRLFIQAVKGNKQIIWPEISHHKEENLDGYKPWVPARNIIDWSLHGESIFRRKKPLAENTLKRIETGITKFWGKRSEPFLCVLRGQSTVWDLDRPLPSVTTSGAHYALIEPFLLQYHGGADGHERNYSIGRPIPTLDCSPRYALVDGVNSTLDIRLRMLQPHELAAAQGFPSDYIFTGTKSDKVKQIGNAVPPQFARAIFGSYL